MKSLTAVFSKLIPATALFFLVASANAQSAGASQVQMGSSATVKCLGIQEDMVVFNVSYPNPGGNRFSLAVKDQDGTQLYQNVFSQKDFYKQFRLPKTNKDKITFVIRNGREADVVKSFEINVNSRFIYDIAVKKID